MQLPMLLDCSSYFQRQALVISLHRCLRSEANNGLVNPRRIAAGHVVIGWQGLARAGKGWLEHPEDTDILIKPSKLYEVI